MLDRDEVRRNQMEVNPYESPKTDADVDDIVDNHGWRDGDQLVIDAHTKLVGSECIYDTCKRASTKTESIAFDANPRIPWPLLALLSIGTTIAIVVAIVIASDMFPTLPFAVWLGLAIAMLMPFVFLASRKSVTDLQVSLSAPVCVIHYRIRLLQHAMLVSLMFAPRFLLRLPFPLVISILAVYPVLFLVVRKYKSALSLDHHARGRFWINGCNSRYLLALPTLEDPGE